jgi:hypothetical protein
LSCVIATVSRVATGTDRVVALLLKPPPAGTSRTAERPLQDIALVRRIDEAMALVRIHDQ